MDIFSDWVFWVIVAAIVFIMALIGYLAEGTSLAKKKKNEAKPNEDNKSVDNLENTNIVNNNQGTINNDWTVLPETSDSIKEVKIDQINEVDNQNVNSQNMYTVSNNENNNGQSNNSDDVWKI